jgi:hypothetical protein
VVGGASEGPGAVAIRRARGTRDGRCTDLLHGNSSVAMGSARHRRRLGAVGSALVRRSASFTPLRPAAAAGAAPLITDVRAARPVAADGSPLPDWGGRQGLGQICVAVDTDDGRTGFGVCGGGAPGITIIETVIHAPPTFRWYARHTLTLHSLPLR